MVGMSTPARGPYSRTSILLDQMPFLSGDVPQWLDGLSDTDFDHVCVSAVTMILVEEQDETGFISATSIARCTRAIRDRYRRICGVRLKSNGRVVYMKRGPRDQNGEKNSLVRLNEWQVRIARKTDRSVDNQTLASIFQVSKSALRSARIGESWKHLSNGNSLRFSKHRT